MAQPLVGTTLDVPWEPSPTGSLTSVDVYIATNCNRRCTYCFLPSDFLASGKRMSLDSFSDVVSWSQRNGVNEITLLGGEPSLHPAFAEMASLASARGLNVRVVTNGARRFRRLLAEGAVGPQNLTRVAVSLDSLDQTLQDEFRGPGAWQDAMATVDLLREHGLLFDINVTAVKPVLPGIAALMICCGRAAEVNIHWPSHGNQAGFVRSIPDRDNGSARRGREARGIARLLRRDRRGFLAGRRLWMRHRPLESADPPRWQRLPMWPARRPGRNGVAVYDGRPDPARPARARRGAAAVLHAAFV